MSRHSHRVKQGGVTLIEAMVAMVIMAFGMVALIGLQSNLRRSGDLAKQRGEAVRIAQQRIEQLRDYSVRSSAEAASAPAGVKAYQDIATLNDPVNAGDANSNASYMLSQTVTPWVEASTATETMKGVSINVSWLDRAGETQFIETHAFIASADPGLSGSLTVPPVSTPLRRPADRDSAIPTGAKDLGNKTSVFKPQVEGTVAWVFNNLTGVVIGKCTVPIGTPTSALTAADVDSCRNNTVGFLLRGFIRFSDSASPDSDQPSSQALPLDMLLDVTGSNYPVTPRYECFDDSPAASDSSITTISYNCVIYPNNDTVRSWSGRLTIAGAGIATRGGNWQVCRYSANYDGDGVISNAEHPNTYATVTSSLSNQNFLIVQARASCPAGHTADPANGYFRTTTTVLHQSESSPSGDETPTPN